MNFLLESIIKIEKESIIKIEKESIETENAFYKIFDDYVKSIEEEIKPDEKIISYQNKEIFFDKKRKCIEYELFEYEKKLAHIDKKRNIIFTKENL